MLLEQKIVAPVTTKTGMNPCLDNLPRMGISSWKGTDDLS